MKWRVTNAGALDPELRGQWALIQQSEPGLQSPYFCVEFAHHVACVRNDLLVAVGESGGEPVAFFPFHRLAAGRAKPMGFGLSDYHGVVAATGAAVNVESLLRACSLIRYEFDHLPVDQKAFGSFVSHTDRSPVVDLAGGFQAFFESRDKAGRKQLRELFRKKEQLEREVGDLRLELDSSDAAHMDALFRWKSAQCRRTGVTDFFARDWCRDLIRSIHADKGSAFGGRLACLFAGNELLAVHFLIHSDREWHSWFPAYATEFQRYSPGGVLLLELVLRLAASDGPRRIDFGKGMDRYKRRFMTGYRTVATGVAMRPSWVNHAIAWQERLESWGRKSILKPVLRAPGRLLKTLQRQRRYG